MRKIPSALARDGGPSRLASAAMIRRCAALLKRCPRELTVDMESAHESDKEPTPCKEPFKKASVSMELRFFRSARKSRCRLLLSKFAREWHSCGSRGWRARRALSTFDTELQLCESRTVWFCSYAQLLACFRARLASSLTSSVILAADLTLLARPTPAPA